MADVSRACAAVPAGGPIMYGLLNASLSWRSRRQRRRLMQRRCFPLSLSPGRDEAARFEGEGTGGGASLKAEGRREVAHSKPWCVVLCQDPHQPLRPLPWRPPALFRRRTRERSFNPASLTLVRIGPHPSRVSLSRLSPSRHLQYDDSGPASASLLLLSLSLPLC